MTTYSVIMGSPPGGSTLPRGTLGILGCLTKDSTPAERLNMALRLGNRGSLSKSGCMKARYSMSARSPASGQMRIVERGQLGLELVAPGLAGGDVLVQPEDQ